MKRLISVVLYLALVLNIISCAPPKGSDASDTPSFADTHETGKTFSENFDNRFGRGFESIVETKDAYYYCYSSGHYIYYYDKPGGIYGVLCPKPECMHDENEPANKNCSGFINSHAKSLFSSVGKLFYVASARTADFIGPALFGMNIDGTGKEMVMKLDFGETQNLCWPQRFDLHRGKLYGWIEYEKVESGAPSLCFAVVCIDTETGDYKTIYEKKNCGTSIIPALFYIDNHLYFTVPDIGEVSGTSILDVYRWNMETETLEVLYSSGESGVYGALFDIWVEEDGSVWLIPIALKQGKNAELYRISDGELQTVFEFQDYGSTHLIGGGAVNVTQPRHEIIVADREGSILKRIENDFSFLEELNYSVDTSRCTLWVYGDIKELLVVYQSMVFEHEDGSSGSGSCLVRYDLTEDEPQAQLLAVSPWN